MITKDMTIGDVLKKKEGVAEVLMEFGMGCLGCPSASMETIEQACFIHGLNLDEVIEKINSL